MDAVLKWITYLLFIKGFASAQFRCDYTYYPEGEGWYKLHITPEDWEYARQICRHEGADLVNPITPGMLEAVRHQLKKNKGLVEVVDIRFDGAIHTNVKVYQHNSNTEAIELLNEMPDHREEKVMILHKNGTFDFVEVFVKLPFVCHKKASAVVQLNPCGTTDDEYILHERTGSCYKFHRMRNFWSRAQHICQVEGGDLAVINSDVEADVIQDVFAMSPSDSIPGDFWVDSAFLGFSKKEGFGWQTVDGTPLNKTGYARWSEREPNNARGDENCGSVGRNSRLFDDPCERELPFICEKKRDSLTDCARDEAATKDFIRSFFKNNEVYN